MLPNYHILSEIYKLKILAYGFHEIDNAKPRKKAYLILHIDTIQQT